MYQQVVHAWMYGKRPYEQVFESLKRAGADGVDLTVHTGIAAPAAKDILSINIQKMANDFGLAIPSVTAGYVTPELDLSHNDSKMRQTAIDFTKGAIDVTAHAGCDRMLVSPSWVSETHQYYVSYEEDWRRAVESIHICGEYAADKGVMLLIEPINRYRTGLVRTVKEGLRMIADVDLPNVHLVPDTFHMNMEEEDGIPRALRMGGAHVKCLHIGDNTRRCPGFGTMDWREIIATLKDIDFSGPLSYEPVSNDYNTGQVSRDDDAMLYFESQLKKGIEYLRLVMDALN